MADDTAIAATQPRKPARASRKRDERVRRVCRKIRRHATWLNQPHFQTLLYTYGALWVRFVDLHTVQAEPVDELGRPNAIADQLQRIAGRLSQLATQLGLSPAAERALKHDAAREAADARWLRMADHAETIEPDPAAPADGAAPGNTNGAPIAGFTAPG